MKIMESLKFEFQELKFTKLRCCMVGIRMKYQIETNFHVPSSYAYGTEVAPSFTIIQTQLELRKGRLKYASRTSHVLSNKTAIYKKRTSIWQGSHSTKNKLAICMVLLEEQYQSRDTGNY